MNTSLDRIGRIALGMGVKDVIWNVGQMGGQFPDGPVLPKLDPDRVPADALIATFSGVPSPVFSMRFAFEGNPGGKGVLAYVSLEHDPDYIEANVSGGLEAFIQGYIGDYGEPQDDWTGDGIWGGDSAGSGVFTGLVTYRIWRSSAVVMILRAGCGTAEVVDPIMGGGQRWRLTREVFRASSAGRSTCLREVESLRFGKPR